MKIIIIIALIIFIVYIVTINLPNKKKRKSPNMYELFHTYLISKPVDKIEKNIPNQENTAVPKKIFRTWCDKNPIRVCGGRSGSLGPMNITKKHCSDWEQIIYGDKEIEELLNEYFGKEHRVTKAYYLLNPKYGAARADLFRYIVIFINGGLYLDMKSCVTGPIPDIPPDKDMIVSYWTSKKPQNHLFKNGEFQNWYVYARPNSPILWEIIERVVQNIYDLYENPYLESIYNTIFQMASMSKGIVLVTTGPIALTLVILNSKYINTVVISPTINESLKYMCELDSQIQTGHYSLNVESLIKPKSTALYIPKNMFCTVDEQNLVSENCVKNFNINMYNEEQYSIFLEKYFMSSFSYFIKLNTEYKINFWKCCMLLIYGGCCFDVNEKLQYPVDILFDFHIPDMWYIDNNIIVVPPNNPVIVEAFNIIYSNPNINLFNLVTSKYTTNISKTSKTLEKYRNDNDIDIVYTWVEITPEFLEEKRIYSNNLTIGDSNENNKFEDHQELKYSIRSLSSHFPNYRNIYIVVKDGQYPKYLNFKNPRIKLVNHSSIIPKEFLPTFNSTTIESYLHHISGLSENYIYINDDMMFLRDINKEFFVQSNSPYIITSSKKRSNKISDFEKYANEPYKFETGWDINNSLLDKFKYEESRYYVSHVPKIYKKSYDYYIENMFKSYYIGNKNMYDLQSSYKFRNNTHLYLNVLIKPYLYNYLFNCEFKHVEEIFIQLNKNFSPQIKNQYFLCVADEIRSDKSDLTKYKAIMTDLFPNKSVYEN